MCSVSINYPLVSIIVITYNSSEFVLETLESIKKQTYQNIELIISDDCSIDETIRICNEWIVLNKNRFIRTELLTIENNTGIPANFNRGLKVAKGEWIKFIAGDDMLNSNCIGININYIKTNSTIKVVQSECEIYDSYFLKEKYIGKTNRKNSSFFRVDITPKDQYNLLLKGNRISAPSIFFAKSLLELINGFDERLKLLEDWPMWIRITERGYKIHFLNEITVKYRNSVNSVTRSGKPYRTERHARELMRFSKYYLKKEGNYFHYYKNQLGLSLIIFLNKLKFNNNSSFSKMVFQLADYIRFLGK